MLQNDEWRLLKRAAALPSELSRLNSLIADSLIYQHNSLVFTGILLLPGSVLITCMYFTKALICSSELYKYILSFRDREKSKTNCKLISLKSK